MGLFPRHPGLDPESSAVGPCGRHRQDRKEMPKDAIAKYGAPEILTTVTCLDWKEARAEQPEIRISRDGRGRAKEIWKILENDIILLYLSVANGAALYQEILQFIDDFIYHRYH